MLCVVKGSDRAQPGAQDRPVQYEFSTFTGEASAQTECESLDQTGVVDLVQPMMSPLSKDSKSVWREIPLVLPLYEGLLPASLTDAALNRTPYYQVLSLKTIFKPFSLSQTLSSWWREDSVSLADIFCLCAH